jgi:type IV pilus assembly protein PilE
MNHSVSRHYSRGVTLIELMIVVVIVAILSAIAIPGYRQYVIRVTRADAKTQLASYASTLERCYTRTNDYTLSGGIGGGGGALPCLTLPFTNAQGTYVFTGNIQPQTYALTATPAGGQTDDTKCAALSQDQAGNQSATGTAPAAECWQGR